MIQRCDKSGLSLFAWETLEAPGSDCKLWQKGKVMQEEVTVYFLCWVLPETSCCGICPQGASFKSAVWYFLEIQHPLSGEMFILSTSAKHLVSAFFISLPVGSAPAIWNSPCSGVILFITTSNTVALGDSAVGRCVGSTVKCCECVVSRGPLTFVVPAIFLQWHQEVDTFTVISYLSDLVTMKACSDVHRYAQRTDPSTAGSLYFGATIIQSIQMFTDITQRLLCR